MYRSQGKVETCRLFFYMIKKQPIKFGPNAVCMRCGRGNELSYKYDVRDPSDVIISNGICYKWPITELSYFIICNDCYTIIVDYDLDLIIGYYDIQLCNICSKIMYKM